ncbi:MAG: SCP2 sterol-binding domain-containing protein [Labilithrix sp.]|nr:SCP2 sterol-binding domain-containing protein [Labilithrix sp.]
MIDEKVRDLFETTIPQELAKGASQGEGFRCRFHIGDAGAWEIDLSRRPRCIEAGVAPGGYHAVVYVSVEDFWSLMQSEGANRDELVAMEKLRASGDRPRAFELTRTIAKAPPFVWPSSLRVVPVDAAFFAATEDNLVHAFPWPSALRGCESFGGHDEESGLAPLAPPFRFVFAPMSSEWWDHLLDFYLALVPDDGDARSVRDDDSLELWEMTDRVFPPAFSGRDRRPNVYAAPRPLVAAFARLSDENVDVLVAKFATRLYPDRSRPNPFTGVEQDYSKYRDAFEDDARRDLRDARQLARSLSPSEALWFWGWFE